MKLDEFKKLELSIQDQDFNNSFKNINKVMFFLSVFGHAASIFLGYYLVSKILSGAITDNPMVVSATTVVLLGGLELLKREIFDKFSLQNIRLKSLVHKDVLPLAIVSLLLISLSFYASVKGAKEFSTKSTQIDSQTEVTIKVYEDSLNKIYNNKNNDVEAEIKIIKDKIEEKDKEQTTLEGLSELSRDNKKRINYLINEKEGLTAQIKTLENKITDNNKLLESKIKEYGDKNNNKAKGKKDENVNNSFYFVIISVLIELLILIGVYFNEYFKYRSYTDFKTKTDKDPKFQQWVIYNSVLDIIYNAETKVNDKLPGSTQIVDLCRMNNISLYNKDMSDLFKLFNSLGITRTSGPARYIVKTKEAAEEILKNHYKIT